MNSSKTLASGPKPLQPTRGGDWLASDRLTKSEIASLRQGKKSIAGFVQKELPERLKQRHLEHLLPKR